MRFICGYVRSICEYVRFICGYVEAHMRSVWRPICEVRTSCRELMAALLQLCIFGYVSTCGYVRFIRNVCTSRGERMPVLVQVRELFWVLDV